MDENASGPRERQTVGKAAFSAYSSFGCQCDEVNYTRLRSALVELGHAMSKSDLDIASRYHMEVFWELLEE